MAGPKPLYKTESINTSVEEKVFSIDKTIKDILNGIKGEHTIIVWQHQGLYIGSVKNGEVSIINCAKMKCAYSEEDQYWVRARIFNEEEEYYIRNINGTFHVRHRKDGVEDADHLEVIDSTAILRGAIVKEEHKEKSEKIEVRNYLGYSATGVVQVEDMRFVKI